MASKKTAVVDYLYDKLTNEGRTVAMFEDVGAAIRHCNEEFETDLKADNPANFMKDLLRGGNASKNWPSRLTERRITGRQVTGDGRIFEFIDFQPGQSEPFPNPFEPTGEEPAFVVQSLSLPLVTKSLGRPDEAWLIQVIVHLKVLETHFANLSKIDVIELSHLQTGVKLNRTEIDSLFLAVVQKGDGQRINALVTCEAKQQKDPVLGDQILRQISAAYASIRDLDLKVELIIPIALKAIKNQAAVYIAEFEAWLPDEAQADEGDQKDLVIDCAGKYTFRPPVPGIGSASRKRRKVATTKPAV